MPPRLSDYLTPRPRTTDELRGRMRAWCVEVYKDNAAQRFAVLQQIDSLPEGPTGEPGFYHGGLVGMARIILRAEGHPDPSALLPEPPELP